MDSNFIKDFIRQDLQDLSGFFFIISSFLKKLEKINPLSEEAITS